MNTSDTVTLVPGHVNIFERREGEVYVHYVGTDKRLDEWIPETAVKSAEEDVGAPGPSSHTANGRKRKRGEATKSRTSSPSQNQSIEYTMDDVEIAGNQGDVPMTEEEYDIQHHKQITAKRNFDKVNFAQYQIKTW